MKPCYFLLTLLLTGFGLSNARADWLNFRGPNASGFAGAAAESPALPTTLGEDSIAWSADLPGRGISSPIIIGDRLFLTCSSGPADNQNRLHVRCHSTSDGSLIWERNFRATGRTMTHKKTCVAAPTMASDGERVFALYSSNDLFPSYSTFYNSSNYSSSCPRSLSSFSSNPSSSIYSCLYPFPQIAFQGQ